MGDSLTSSSPLSNSDQKSNMPMLYYGLVVVATAAIVLAVYNLIVIKRCGRRHMPPPSQPTNIGVVEERRSLSRNLLSSFKYKKEAEEEEEGEGGLGISRRSGRDCEEDSCAVCLSGFEEGEEVRKLPRCNHCFHALCIDMWLYSHFDCPICRTPVVAAAFSRSSGDENAVAVAVSV